jgi:IS5 family transposase
LSSHTSPCFLNVSRGFPSDPTCRIDPTNQEKSGAREAATPGHLDHRKLAPVDFSKVPPPQAVDRLAQILDSPEVGRLVRTLEYVRWTGRPGYPVRAMVGMCLVKSLYALPTWSRTARLVGEHPGLQAVLGCAPSQWACYRFARMLRTRDDWVLAQCVEDVIASLKAECPEMGRDVAVDASDLPAYANGQRLNYDGTERTFSDPDASWGHRSAVSTRGKGGFYGYKIDAAVDVATGLPIAWDVRSARHAEQDYALPLIRRVRERGFQVQTAIMDKGYDSNHTHGWCAEWGIAAVIPLKETERVKRGAGEPPPARMVSGSSPGADYKRKATKWRCPTGECQPSSMWVKADRLHPLIPRDSKRYKNLYRQRSRVEGQFGQLKHEWSLLPLRVRGLASVRLHADLTILTVLATRLACDRRGALPLAA